PSAAIDNTSASGNCIACGCTGPKPVAACQTVDRDGRERVKRRSPHEIAVERELQIISVALYEPEIVVGRSIERGISSVNCGKHDVVAIATVIGDLKCCFRRERCITNLKYGALRQSRKGTNNRIG